MGKVWDYMYICTMKTVRKVRHSAVAYNMGTEFIVQPGNWQCFSRIFIGYILIYLEMSSWGSIQLQTICICLVQYVVASHVNLYDIVIGRSDFGKTLRERP